MEDKHSKELEESKERDRNIINAGITGANADMVQRYGAGIKEHIVAYEGIDNESGQQLSRSLKKISEYKVDEEHPDTSYRQQAGFAAERLLRERMRKRLYLGINTHVLSAPMIWTNSQTAKVMR